MITYLTQSKNNLTPIINKTDKQAANIKHICLTLNKPYALSVLIHPASLRRVSCQTMQKIYLFSLFLIVQRTYANSNLYIPDYSSPRTLFKSRLRRSNALLYATLLHTNKTSSMLFISLFYSLAFFDINQQKITF